MLKVLGRHGKENSRLKHRKNEISFVTVVENTISEGDKISTDSCDTIMKIRHEYCSPMNFHDREFRKSICDPSTILITLRINSDAGQIVGYVKGGPLEKHKPGHGGYDEV